jgi:hypothetical protein
VVRNAPGGSAGLVRTGEQSVFHDPVLATATREINSTLTRVVRENTDPERKLHFLRVGGGLLLAWVWEVADKQDPDACMETIFGSG